MPEPLQQSEINSQTDPSVSKQYDSSTPKSEQLKDLHSLIDGFSTCMLTTQRQSESGGGGGVDIDGPVSRSMGIAKREGSALLFLANAHSRKFEDIRGDSRAQVTFQDSAKSQDWISLTGKVVTASNDDPRIKELYSKAIRPWFGDLGDGKHDGGPDDPRMALIEFRPSYAVYWKHTLGAVGFAVELGRAAVTGQVADTGVLRELRGSELN